MASTTSPPPQSRTKLSKTIHSIITFKNQTKATNCLHLHNNKLNSSNNHFNKQLANSSMYAFVAKLFATVSSLKAAYAELQTAQFPYDGETVKRSDLEVVDELKTISDLKRCFMKKQIDSSPVHITLLLSEIKEQQSLMKMYQITIRKLEIQVKSKDLEIDSLQKLLTEANSTNDLIETKLSSSSCFPRFDVALLMSLFMHRHPLNMIMLGLFTVAFALIVGVSCVFSKGKIIFEASILTSIIVVSLTLFTFWAAKQGYDFNFLGPFLFCALILILVFSIIQLFFPMGSLVRMIISFVVALIYCGFIIYDTDNLIKRCSYDEYVMAAAMLYIDMIQLFIAILQILGILDD